MIDSKRPGDASIVSTLASAWLSLVLAATVLALLVLNVATLTNNAVHAKVFGVLERVSDIAGLASLLPDILANSPTQTRKIEVESKTKSLRGEKEALLIANKGISAERDTLIKKVADLDARHRSLAEEHTNLQGKHKSLLATHDSLRKGSFDRANIARATSQRISQKVSIVAARGVVTLLPRSVPFAGAAISATVLTMDLVALCDTMRALDELNSAFDYSFANAEKVCGLKVPGS